jgi:hypothetical protein
MYPLVKKINSPRKSRNAKKRIPFSNTTYKENTVAFVVRISPKSIYSEIIDHSIFVSIGKKGKIPHVTIPP